MQKALKIAWLNYYLSFIAVFTRNAVFIWNMLIKALVITAALKCSWEHPKRISGCFLKAQFHCIFCRITIKNRSWPLQERMLHVSTSLCSFIWNVYEFEHVYSLCLKVNIFLIKPQICYLVKWIDGWLEVLPGTQRAPKSSKALGKIL